jgi:tRNA-specific 2-thiouridylase
MAQVLELGDLNWLAPPPEAGEEVQVQIRHQAPAQRAVLETPPPSVRLRLSEPVWAITPGQSGVVFRGDLVLGGGRILGSEG